MDGYAVVIEEIRVCGRDAVAVGEDVARVELGRAVFGLASAMPASAAGRVAGTLGAAWHGRVHALSAAVGHLGVGLGEVAERYADDDAAARENLERVDARAGRYR